MAVSNRLRQESYLFLFIALSCAFLIAASQSSPTQGGGVIGGYIYWVLRILIEAFLFFAFREVVERYLLPNKSAITTASMACALSLIPFVLAITAFDLILGYPELGIEDSGTTEHGRLAEFGLELVYLSDNHFALCLLLSVFRLFQFNGPNETKKQLDEEGFLQTIDPQLHGDILWITAQEHYVKIVTTKESRTVLHRFSDLIRDLSSYPGMQVHRSHWVTFDAITDLEKSGQTMKVILSTGDIIPISRTYRSQLEEKIAETMPELHKE
ncbi:putative LytTr DNA-binding domain family [Candidatus Terasakiella magnetica]|uniref:Putative LytTr DNA-binding domain family n=1 Tax=Candidatus Terasakiella magnetica TaxID=1867952 RepID=A0A1C3RFI0_9PROT|nr:LytTR family DNA-binding domain-containing protein [Candidatus Terasakiella magnetica]SCA56047.1 putative LytTr DNA-binding domain family [Candidatus Terasakiella magnetica]